MAIDASVRIGVSQTPGRVRSTARGKAKVPNDFATTRCRPTETASSSGRLRHRCVRVGLVAVDPPDFANSPTAIKQQHSAVVEERMVRGIAASRKDRGNAAGVPFVDPHACDPMPAPVSWQRVRRPLLAADLALSFRGHQPESKGPRHQPVSSETRSVGQGGLTPSSSFTQLGGTWMRDLDLGSKVRPSARALERVRRSSRVRGSSPARQRLAPLASCPSGKTAQTNSPRFLLR